MVKRVAGLEAIRNHRLSLAGKSHKIKSRLFHENLTIWQVKILACFAKELQLRKNEPPELFFLRKFFLALVVFCVSVSAVGAAGVGHVVISEVMTDAGGDNEFVELFNPTDDEVDLTGWKLKKITSSGSDTTYLDSRVEGKIPAHGFYYFAPSASNFASEADEIYSADSNRITNNNGLRLLDADSNEIDLVWWGTVATFDVLRAASNSAVDQSIARKFDENNFIVDSDDNLADFAISASPTPQNSASDPVDPATDDDDLPEDQNEPPKIPTDLTPLGTTSLTVFSAKYSDPEGEMGRIEFRIFAENPASCDAENFVADETSELVGNNSLAQKTIALDEGEYFWCARATDNEGAKADSEIQNFTLDVTPPSSPTEVSQEELDSVVKLFWQNPADDFSQVFIFQSENPIATDFPDPVTAIFAGVGTEFSAENLSNGVEYFFKIFAVDAANNFSVGVEISATPNGPTIETTAEPGELIFNEVAWAGSTTSSSDEWIELRNTTSNKIFNLAGWKIVADDGAPEILLAGEIQPGAFFLLERTDDSTVPDFVADQIFTGSLSNDGEILRIFDSANSEIDRVDGSSAWAIGGDADTRQTLARIDSTKFRTSFEVDGTPRAPNFRDYDLALSEISASPAKPLPGETTIFKVKIENRGLNLVSANLVWKIGDEEILSDPISNLESFASVEKTFSLSLDSDVVISATLEFPADELLENNFGALNLSVRDHLVINEFAPNPIGADDGYEWIELLNPTASAISLDGFKINSTPIAGSIEPGGFFVLDNFTGLTNTSGEIVLRDSAGVIVDSQKYSTAIEGKSFGRDAANLTSWLEFWHPTKNAANIESNLSPVAAITIQGSGNANGECALFVNLTAENSTDPDGDALFFEWDFGNGETSDEENPGGFYFAPGNYEVSLTATDALGASAESRQNFTVAGCSSGGGGTTTTGTAAIADEPFFDSVSAERVEVKITEVSFNSAADWIEIFVANDGNNGNGIDLGGFYFESDKRIKTIPQNLKLKTGEFLVLEFKSATPENILRAEGFTKIFSARAGFTATDEQVTLRDSTGVIEDAVAWENRSGAWSSGEEADMLEIVAGGGWISAELADAIDSSAIAREVVIARDPDLPDSNSALDWFTTIAATPGQKNSARPVRANDFHFQISAVAPKNPSGDFVEVTCLDCAELVVLGGFSFKNSLEEVIFSFPPEATIALGAPLRVIFNAPEDKFSDGVFYSTARGLVGSDDLLALQDSENATADFVGWSNRAVSPLCAESDLAASQIKQLQKRFAEFQWDSDVAESLLDSRELDLGGIFLRQNSADTNSAADFSIQNPDPPLDPIATTTGDVRISEILPNPVGQDTGNEWFELANRGSEPVNLFGWVVVVGNNFFEFEENIELAPGEFRVFRGLLSLRNSASQFTLLDFDGTVVDSLNYPDLSEGVAFARTSRGEFAKTKLPTPNHANIFYQILAASVDADGDGLSDLEENALQTDPENFDTDGDGLPDLFEVQNDSDPLVADANLVKLQKYRAELALIAGSQLTSLADENGVFLTGVGVPGGRMRIFIQSELSVVEVPIDENGVWNYALDRPLESGEHNLFTQLLDQGGFEGVAQKVLSFKLAQSFTPPTFAESLRISEILPNPVGEDADNEFIELENFGSETADLSGFTLSLGRKKFTFPANFTLAPGELRALTHAETALTITNSGGTVLLAWPTGRVLDSLVYPKTKEGSAFAFDGSQFLATSSPTPGSANVILTPAEKSSKKTSKYANGNLSATIRISEILANPVGDDSKNEFIELENFGSTSVNLGNWRISDKQKTFIIPDSIVLRPGEFKILPRSLTKLALNNSGREEVRIANFQGAQVDSLEFESPAEGVALAFDSAEIRETTIATPNNPNDFDTQKLFGTIQFRGEDGFVIQTSSGEVFVRFGEDTSALLARAIFREGGDYSVFTRSENGVLTLAGFDIAPEFLQTDLLAFDLQDTEATPSWPTLLVIFAAILFALRFAKIGEVWQPTR